jgi:hypothetical protein
MLLRRRTPSRPPVADVQIEERWAMAESGPDEAPWFHRVNVALRDIAGHPEYRHALQVSAPMRGTDATRLPDEEELTALGDLEDALIESLSEDRQSLAAAVLTRDGERRFIFYTRDPDAAAGRVKAVREGLPGRMLEGSLVEDVSWTVYAELVAAVVEAHRRP